MAEPVDEIREALERVVEAWAKGDDIAGAMHSAMLTLEHTEGVRTQEVQGGEPVAWQVGVIPSWYGGRFVPTVVGDDRMFDAYVIFRSEDEAAEWMSDNIEHEPTEGWSMRPLYAAPLQGRASPQGEAIEGEVTDCAECGPKVWVDRDILPVGTRVLIYPERPTDSRNEPDSRAMGQDTP